MKEIMKNALRYGTFPVIGASSITFFIWLYKTNAALVPVASIGALIGISLLLHIVEKVIPYRPEWKSRDGQEFNDLRHAFFGTILGSQLGYTIVALIFPFLAAIISEKLGSTLWPEMLPLWVQVCLVILLAELGRYWEHRMMHSSKMWRFHVLHHSTEKLTVLKTFRKDTIERCFQSVISLGPLILLGAPPALVLVYGTSSLIMGLFSHTSADLRLGILEVVANGPASHRFHHSLDRKESDSNFGGILNVWDILFGTYTYPLNKNGPKAVGIEDDCLPKTWLPQYLAPFMWKSIQKTYQMRKLEKAGRLA